MPAAFVPSLPKQGTVQLNNPSATLSQVVYTPETDPYFVAHPGDLPSAKLMTLMNNSSNVMFPIFYGANSTVDDTAGKVVRLQLDDPGLGYAQNPANQTPGTTVKISGGTPTTTATAIVQVAGDGSLFGLELKDGGSGYKPGDQLTVTFETTSGPTKVAKATAFVSQATDTSKALYDPKDPLNKTYRGYVGEINAVTGNYDLGLQPGHQVTVQIPIAFWDGGRIYFATNGSVPLTGTEDPGYPLQNSAEWTYNPTTDLNVIQSFVVAPTATNKMPIYGANFADPVTGYFNPYGVVMWYRDLEKPKDFGHGVPAALTEATFRDPKQYFIAPDMKPSEIDTIINYDVSYVDSLAMPASMEGTLVPLATTPTTKGNFTWLGSDMSLTEMQEAINKFTTNDVTGGKPGVSGVNGLGTYFGGLGYDQFYLPADNSPSGAILSIDNNNIGGPITINVTTTAGLVQDGKVTITGVTGRTALNATWEITSLSLTSFQLKGITGDGISATGGSYFVPNTGIHVQKVPAGFQVIADSANQNSASPQDPSKFFLVSGGTKANIDTISTGLATATSTDITGVSTAVALKLAPGMIWSPVNGPDGKPYFPNGTTIESITIGTVGNNDSIIKMSAKANTTGSPGHPGAGGSWTFSGSQYTSTTGTIAANGNTITGLDPAIGIYLRPGMMVTGAQIPPNPTLSTTQTFIQSISPDFTQITLTQSIGGTASSGPYTFLGSPSSYIVQKLINVWYAWADFYVKELASGPNAAPTGSFTGTTTANGGRTDYNSLILKITQADGPSFNINQLRVGDVVTSAGATLTPNTSGDPSLNYTIVRIDTTHRTVELSLPVAVTGDPVSDTFTFVAPKYIVRSKDAPLAPGTAGTIHYTLDFDPEHKPAALEFARVVYDVMQSFSLLLDPETLLSRSALLLRYSIGGNVGSFTTNDGFFNQTGRHTTLPHDRTHIELRDEIKSILRGVYDFNKVPDQSLWYPDPAKQTPGATLDTGSGAAPIDFGISNLNPYVWFVHTVLHNSSYGFSLDDDVANTTAKSNSIQVAFGGNAYTAEVTGTSPPAPILKNLEAFTPGAPYGTTHSEGFIDVTSSYAKENAKPGPDWPNGMVTISGLSQATVARLVASTQPENPPGALITSDSAGLLPAGVSVRVALAQVLPPKDGKDDQSWVTFLRPMTYTVPTDQTHHQFTFSSFTTDVPTNVTPPNPAQAPAGSKVKITGNGFTGVFGVTFNGIPGTLVAGAITSIDNNNGSQITIHTANTLQLADGDIVTISGVTGQTAINGQWIVTGVNGNSFKLPTANITGNGINSSGGNWVAGTDSSISVIVPKVTPNANGTTYPGPTGKIGIRNGSGTGYSTIDFTVLSVGTRVTRNGVLQVVGTPGADAMLISAAGTNLLVSTGSGTQSFARAGISGIEVFSGAGGDLVKVAANVVIPVFIDGGTGSDTLVGANVANTWRITGQNAGSVGRATFRDVENLTGGLATDRFVLVVSGSVAGNVRGGGGADALDYSAFATAIAANLQTGVATAIGGTFGQIEALIGSAAVDSLVGPNGANVWTITRRNTGGVNGFGFTGVETLVGGAATDRFRILDSAGLGGAVHGGGGTDTLDYSAFATAISTNLQAGVSTAIGATFTGIERLIGGAGVDTLAGANDHNVWTVSGPNAGTVDLFTFLAVERLIGGTAVDIFRFSAAGRVDGVVNAAAGSDWLDYRALPGGVFVNLAAGIASRTPRAVGVENVLGSWAGDNMLSGDGGNNVLVGYGWGNSLVGGDGRDLLIGGQGTSVLYGGGGDDLVIGGRTVFDQSIAALQALMAEWSRNTSYAARVSNLLTGAGLTGGRRLTLGTTVFVGGAPTLAGLTGQDFFVVGQASLVTDLDPRTERFV